MYVTAKRKISELVSSVCYFSRWDKEAEMTAKIKIGKFPKRAVCFLLMLSMVPLSETSAINKKGVVFGSWWHDGYSTQQAYQSLDNLVDTGANYVGILATWYIDATDGNEYSQSNIIYQHPLKSPSDVSLVDIIRRAKSK